MYVISLTLGHMHVMYPSDMYAALQVDSNARPLYSVVSLKCLKESLTSLRYRLSFGELLHAAAVLVRMTMDVADVYKCMQTHTHTLIRLCMCVCVRIYTIRTTWYTWSNTHDPLVCTSSCLAVIQTFR